ncbi:response regulator transcription factor [Paenibacillus barcinonensis]|uniref:LuxR family two component transcriptional regulator n=1 Tax=Paenibacillus barcinonensis TaxID=198119 RepID=A0A2V4VM05_PAEBA|nr:response regulator transcription factor [Paenibacillus barcinonensis]PYE47312.1 LuxR family two component transcriptional regulator [Paenibacillus barcinonensis]QKS58213.1 response regulator transcription factor [Paenibacillus barcinonensis]
MERVRVLVVDDHAHAREAICSILSEDSLFEVIGIARNGQEALEQTEQWMPDLILMDVQMPDMDGLEATRQIKLRFPYVIIVMVTVSDDVTYLFEALKQGAQGYLRKNLSPSTWLEYLRAIVSDDAPLSKELAYRILQEFPSPRHEEIQENPLTARELEILQWVSAGYTNREIAEQLGISDQTVKNHLKNILQKLQLENRVQLTRYALESGLAGRKSRK